MLNEIIEIVKSLVGNEYLYFATAVQVQTGEFTNPFYAWAVCVSPKDNLYVMDAGEQWHKVETEDTALLERLYFFVQEIKKDYTIKSKKDGGNVCL